MAPRLVVLPNWLGDLVMAEPALRRWRGGGRLVGVCDPALAPLVRDAGIVDEVEVYDRRGRDRGPLGLWRRGRSLARHRAVEVLVLGPSLRAAALAAASGATRRIGHGGEFREVFLTDVAPRVARPRDVHLADDWYALAGDGRRSDDAVQPRWPVGDVGRRGLDALVEHEPTLARGRFAVFGAGATYGPAKQWDADRFAALARALRASWDLDAVFIGGPDSGERTLAERLATASDGLSLAGRTDLPTLAALLAAATVFVGNDSGPMHLAAAVGAPTVGIFGSTSPRWTAPRGPACAVVGPSPVSCSPCFLRRCPFARECLVGIGVDDVSEVVREVLGSFASAPGERT